MLKTKIIPLFIGLVVAIILYFSFFNKSDFKESVKKDIENYKNNMISMDGSPIVDKNLDKFKFFEPNKKYVFEAKFTAQNKNASFLMTDSSKIEMKLAGIAEFKLDNQNVVVEIYDETKNYLLPFRDGTSGNQTYGGGRYINIPKEYLVNGNLTIDFNKAHNFYCAYNPQYVCPVPPKGNNIPVEILAGEMNYEH